jgi:membrane dipeptidase
MRTITAAGVVAGLPKLPRAEGSGVESQNATRIIVDGLDTSVLNEEFLHMLQAAKVDCVHFSVSGLPSYGVRYEFFDKHPDEIGLVTTVSEIREAHEKGRIAVIFGSQESNWLEALMSKSAGGTTAPFSALRAAYALGLRILGICYQATNIFGGGALDPHVPLTRPGRMLVEKIHELGILLDVGGHTAERTSLDAIEMSKGVPVVCTHTNVAALNDNMRAVSDKLIEAIAKTGGVVGVTAISDFQMRNADNASSHGPVSPQATLDVHLDQYDYIRKLVGEDHVGLGPDFVWGWGDTFVLNPESSLTFPPEALSVAPPVMTVKGFEDISKLPNLVKGLQERGWSEEQLDKLLGLNWLRVYEKVWGR